jgi:hypothetical protein
MRLRFPFVWELHKEHRRRKREFCWLSTMHVLHQRTLTLELELTKCPAARPPIWDLTANAESMTQSRSASGIHTGPRQFLLGVEATVAVGVSMTKRKEPHWLPGQFGSEPLIDHSPRALCH